MVGPLLGGWFLTVHYSRFWATKNKASALREAATFQLTVPIGDQSTVRDTFLGVTSNAPTFVDAERNGVQSSLVSNAWIKYKQRM